ncbi:MAG: hypothetical protein O2923_13540 [Verrucomicrobia bacterium]|nr:hypothetical protein [Verrucomicrobiota bacterium]MDA1086547.1 hypothetical protein [Verrucomicrobiota bacterium]
MTAEIPSWPAPQLVNDDQYWNYRFRLVALLGSAALGDDDAQNQLLAFYQNGGPQERMDALLAFTELGTVPDGAFRDLFSEELPIAATAANLIATHGLPGDRQKMRQLFQGSPYWQELRASGLNDHGLFHYLKLDDRE